MLVQLTRFDGGETGDHHPFVAVNPESVAAVFDSRYDPDCVIVRLHGGLGLKVKGPYSEVLQRLNQELHAEQQAQE
jgi:hypothetical protein